MASSAPSVAPTRGAAAAPVLLEARAVGKRYPGVIALDNVSIELREGQIHALLGENGAGKSTLIGLLSGLSQADGGELLAQGEPTVFASVHQAQRAGISTIYQEQALAPELTVVQNVFLGRELRRAFGLFLDDKAMKRRVADLAQEFGLAEADLDRPAGELGALKQHVAQILKALAFDARVLIMDEPTSGLEDHERHSLFDQMRKLRDRGVAILWVTHRLDELTGLADVITVLRDGQHVATVEDPSAETPESLVRLMVGRKAHSLGDVAGEGGRVRWAGAADEVLCLEGVSRAPLLKEIDLVVRRGEVLGIAGIAGAGRTELARVVLGVDRLDAGRISVNGAPAKIRNPRDAYRLGIAMVPEERKTQAVLGDFTLSKNMTISDVRKVSRGGLVIDRRREQEVAEGYIKQLGVKTTGAGARLRNLSGGNQQKVVIARCLFTSPSLLIVDEPTQGIDVAAKSEVYRLIYDFVDNGGAAIVISSELPELTRVSDRVLVMRGGRIVGEVAGTTSPDAEGDSQMAEQIMTLAAREVAS
jgi:ABC-type sugar transport system ATPase subunit